MKIQLQEYFQNKLPKHNFLDTTLSPLLDQVKEHKINSFHQLRSKLQNYLDTAEISFNHSQQPAPIFPNKNVSKLKKESFCYSQKVSPSHKNNLISTIDSHGQTSKSRRQFDGASFEQRIVVVNPVSKVKKHLIQNIDFKQIQRVMYHQPDKTNKYQFFFQSLGEKRAGTSSHKYKSAPKNKKRLSLMDNGEAFALVPNAISDSQQKMFRIAQKKRFWVNTRENNQRKTQSSLLEVRNFAKTVYVE